jgi:hypothetical protein
MSVALSGIVSHEGCNPLNGCEKGLRDIPSIEFKSVLIHPEIGFDPRRDVIL